MAGNERQAAGYRHAAAHLEALAEGYYQSQEDSEQRALASRMNKIAQRLWAEASRIEHGRRTEAEQLRRLCV